MLIGGLVLQGLSGIAGGIGLTVDPSGESLDIPLEWLAGSPFPDYLIPGVFLLTVLGIGPLLIARGVWRRRPWSWAASVMVGVVLFLWIAIEIGVIGYQAEPPLQLIYGILALVILGATALPGIREHLREP
jgi:hypothetical protein